MTDDPQERLPFDKANDEEGLFDAQLTLPLPAVPWAEPVREIMKRDGRCEPFDRTKIAQAILKAVPEDAAIEPGTAESIASAVAIFLSKRINGKPATADQVSDAVERVLIHMSQAEVALAYARYRDRRARIRRLRKGDMRALLSEIEEARHERGAALARDLALHVQTSQDRLVEWDRSRIVAALQLETGLDAALASIIAAEVEQQIQNAGITALTASLVRELVGAKLIEHGLSEENELRRRLGVPLYDASKIIRGCTPETLYATPHDTDTILARAVKKEYALAEVFSAPVTQAHLLGQIHLNDLESVDRLHEGELFWLDCREGEGARECAAEPYAGSVSPADFISRLMRLYDCTQEYFRGQLGWYAFNVMAAPLLAKADDQDMRAFARSFILECTHRAGFRAPMRISLHWNVPASLLEYLKGKVEKERYKELERAARRLLLAVLEVYREGDARGEDFPAPLLDVYLEEGLFQAFEGSGDLIQAVRTALKRPGVRFILKEDVKPLRTAPAGGSAGFREIVWHRVALNLPRAAVSVENEAAFWKELDRICEIAVKAHAEKRHFIESMFHAEGCSPLAGFARALQDQMDFAVEDALFMVDADGLYECAEIFLGPGQALFAKRIEFMQNVLNYLHNALKHLSDREGILCPLSANINPEISKRFASVDAGLFPSLVDAVIKTEEETQTLVYTSGAALPVRCALSPMEIARLEGGLQQRLAGHPVTRIPMPFRNASESTLGDLLKKAFLQTDCKALALVRNKSEASF